MSIPDIIIAALVIACASYLAHQVLRSMAGKDPFED